MRAARRNPQSGFTLTELMVVIAIVGVLGSLAVSGVSTEAQVETAANSLALRIGDASREARSAGPILETVAAAEGDDSSRTRVFFDTDEVGQYYAVELRQEDDEVSSSYTEISRSYLRSDTEIAGYETVARTSPGGTVTALPAGLEFPCSSAGVCGPATFYLQSTSGPTLKYRVVVLPLSSQPLVLSGW